MKQTAIIILSTVLLFTLIKCETTKESVDFIPYKDSLKITDHSKNIVFFLTKGQSFNHPSFVIWKEAMNGDYIETIFITKSYASGIFGHAALSDSTWDNKQGESIQPATLPYWTHKKGLINNSVLVPNKKNPFIDAYTGATPTGNFKFETSAVKETVPYRILLEVNQAWDWNKYWTNNKFPKNNSYKHSAQPSLIYAVTVNNTDSVYFMNPVGHGNPKGEIGTLYTNISTMTSAKDIFKTIKIVKQK